MIFLCKADGKNTHFLINRCSTPKRSNLEMKPVDPGQSFWWSLHQKSLKLQEQFSDVYRAAPWAGLDAITLLKGAFEIQ
jgi:hypothetical protein